MEDDNGKDGGNGNGSGDICRVCRCEGTSDRPLFHPCLCAGSIKFIHQECLVQWMRYSRKEFCELCGYLFSFTPIYAADMPGRLPLKDVISGLAASVARAAKHWIHYSLVALAWLGFVPLTAYRVYRCLFTGSVSSILTLPLDLLSMDNLGSDVLHGFLVVSCTLVAFIGLVWLREQILHGGGPDWMDGGIAPAAPPEPVPPDLVPGQDGVQVGGDIPPEDGENNNNPNNNNNNNNNNINNNPPEELVEDVVGREGDGGLLPPVAEEEPVGDGVIDGGEVGEVGREGGAEGDGLGGAGGQAAGEWNHMEWERAAEELTWERLLGLDGSLMFLEHVFWVVSLNTLFVLVFAFCPYHVGHFAVVALRASSLAAASRFEGLVTTLVGYCALGIALALLHAIASALKLARARHLLALCCLVVKVSLLSVVEIGVLPLACGWWLDVCSLALFDAALKDRELGFRLAPGTSLFLHWLFGMMYVYYFASFVLLLREVLRPGVLWFLRNLNDPDFSPIREMIHLPLLRHARRLVASAVIFGTAVLLMLWLPVQLLRTLFPSFLPYTVSISAADHPSAHPGSGELSLELLLLQVSIFKVVLPAILEQSHARVWLKSIVRAWCVGASWLLGLRSYLLGDPKDGPEGVQAAAPPEGRQEAGAGNNDINQEGEAEEAEAAPVAAENEVREPQAPPPVQPQPFGLGLGVAHQALLQREGPPNVGTQSYVRPPFFPLRLAALLVLLCISLVFASVIALTLPVWLGRKATALWLLPPATATTLPTNAPGKVHELYTAACGLYVCWAAARAGGLLAGLALAQGRTAILPRIRTCLFIAARSAVACILLLGVFPLMLGLLLDVVVVVPLRVPLNQSPLLFIWQDWALGVLYTKIAVALVMILGHPDWWLRRALERAYRDGIRDLSLSFIITQLAAPLLMALGLALAVPYAIAHGLAPLLVSSLYKRILIARSIYPSLLASVIVILMITFQVRQFRRLYAHIRDDKYLVGRRLVNYNHQRRKPSTSATAGSSTPAAQA